MHQTVETAAGRAMTPLTSLTRTLTGALVALVALVGAAACDGSKSSGSTAGPYTLWDPYPQFEATASWPEVTARCGQEAGVTLRRTGYETTQLTDKALLAAQQNRSPDILVVDNPDVSTLAAAGALVSAADFGLSTTGIAANLLASGRYQGKAYGTPIGANTLALYYNAAILREAGVTPSSVRDWDSLNQALAQVAKTGRMGISFSAIGTEEGTFQFLPWFWGADADLRRLDSPAAERALSLWATWLRKGYAPVAVINNSQTTAWQDFLTGEYAFVENGTWQMQSAAQSGLSWGVIVLPAENGGTAASPVGGEFVTAPVQRDTARYAITRRIIQCLVEGKNALTTDTALNYVAAVPAQQQEQVTTDTRLKPWVQAVHSAQGRTRDLVGTGYRDVSQSLWTAVQAVLTAGRAPQEALSAAQARVR